MQNLSEQHEKKWALLKKWGLLILSAFSLLSFGYLIYLYVDIQKNKTKDFAQTKTRVLAETSIEYIDKIERYHDEHYYHIVYGSDTHGKDYIAFVPQNSEQTDIRTVSKEEMLTESMIKSKWEKTCQACQFIHLTPAIIEDEILWELTYTTQKEQYVFNYYTIDDGELYEQIKLFQRFK